MRGKGLRGGECVFRLEGEFVVEVREALPHRGNVAEFEIREVEAGGDHATDQGPARGVERDGGLPIPGGDQALRALAVQDVESEEGLGVLPVLGDAFEAQGRAAVVEPELVMCDAMPSRYLTRAE